MTALRKWLRRRNEPPGEAARPDCDVIAQSERSLADAKAMAATQRREAARERSGLTAQGLDGVLFRRPRRTKTGDKA